MLAAISVDKDVDGFHPLNIGKLAMKVGRWRGRGSGRWGAHGTSIRRTRASSQLRPPQAPVPTAAAPAPPPSALSAGP